MRPQLCAFFSLLLLTACGGGGSGSDEPQTQPPVTPPPTSPPAVDTFVISGTITASANHAVDSDTNDPARATIPNNSPETAQPLPNPVTLGGYINRAGAGEAGSTFDNGDVDDYFQVELLAGQRVTMLVADFETADADLYLYNTQGEIIDFSIDTGEIESLLIERDGTYIVNAFAFSGATNYILAVGSPDTLALPLPGRPDFVAGEAVVKLKNVDDASADSTTRELRNRLGLEQRAGGRGRSRLMALRPEMAAQRLRLASLRVTAQKAERIAGDSLLSRWETLHTIKALRSDPRIEFAEPNYRVHSLAVPNDEAYPLQWHYPLIGLPQAWDTTTGGADIIVAVIDTGVLPGHPDLVGQFVDGYDFVRDSSNAADGDGIDPIPRDPGDKIGSSFHGTHVSGTIAARGGNNRGVAGVAYTSKIMPLRGLGVEGGTTYDIDQAMRYAAGMENDSGLTPLQPADVINLSLGGAAFSQSTQALMNQITASGIVIVAAAGNEASLQPSYPAAYDNVISVSAVDSQRRLSPYSNFGATIDVAAPGGDNSIDITGDGYPDGVLSTGGDNSGDNTTFVYSFLSGTSMAAPHVAGVIALMKSINPALTPQDIDALLASGAITDDLGTPGRDDQFGYGLINAQSAVSAALTSIGSAPADNPRLVSSATTINFGATTTSLELTLRNGGQDDLELSSITASEPWVGITAGATDAAGLGTYLVNVNRESLDVGVYSADISAVSSANSVTIRVFMSVGGEGFAADVGVLYILLYDPGTDETAGQVVANGSDGVYTYRFEDVSAGEYEIIAGSDADNDLFICDAGESCGAYLTSDQPIRLNVSGDQSGLDFPAEYVVSLPSLQAAQHSNSQTTGAHRRAPTISHNQ